jgi:uncharacterized integral membrane protein
MIQPSIDRRGKVTLWSMVLAIVLALVVIFVAENFVVIELRLITMAVQVRLAWAVLIAAGLGVVIGLLLPRAWR